MQRYIHCKYVPTYFIYWTHKFCCLSSLQLSKALPNAAGLCPRTIDHTDNKGKPVPNTWHSRLLFNPSPARGPILVFCASGSTGKPDNASGRAIGALLTISLSFRSHVAGSDKASNFFLNVKWNFRRNWRKVVADQSSAHSFAPSYDHSFVSE